MRDEEERSREEKRLCAFQQREVLVTGDVCGAQVVQDDEHRHGSVAGNDNGAQDTPFGVDTMVAFKDTAQALIGNGGDTGHGVGFVSQGKLHVFGGDERWGTPTGPGIMSHEALFVEDVFQRDSIVKEHGGRLAIDRAIDSDLGRATTVHLQLPLATGDPASRTNQAVEVRRAEAVSRAR